MALQMLQNPRLVSQHRSLSPQRRPSFLVRNHCPGAVVDGFDDNPLCGVRRIDLVGTKGILTNEPHPRVLTMRYFLLGEKDIESRGALVNE